MADQGAGDGGKAGNAGGVALCERYAVADVDSHIIEPADLWTSRVSAKWGDLVPHVRCHERRQEDFWYIGDRKLYGVGRLRPGPVARVPAVAPAQPRPGPARRDRPPRAPRLPRRDGHLLPGALPQHRRVPQPRVHDRDAAVSWPPSASGPTTTG